MLPCVLSCEPSYVISYVLLHVLQGICHVNAAMWVVMSAIMCAITSACMWNVTCVVAGVQTCACWLHGVSVQPGAAMPRHPAESCADCCPAQPPDAACGPALPWPFSAGLLPSMPQPPASSPATLPHCQTHTIIQWHYINIATYCCAHTARLFAASQAVAILAGQQREPCSVWSPVLMLS